MEIYFVSATCSSRRILCLLNNSMGESHTFRIRLPSVHNLRVSKNKTLAMFINPFQRIWVISH